MQFVDLVKRTYPAHYALYNTELYFSNMLMADLGLRDQAFKVVAYVANGTAFLICNSYSTCHYGYISCKTIYCEQHGQIVLLDSIQDFI